MLPSRIKSSLLTLVLLSSSQLQAQNGPYDQSPSSYSWKSRESEFVKLIYPDFMSDKSKEVIKDIDHFSKSVGLSYGISSPQQFTLILRPEIADPNGFVTLGPRRSEWHAMSTFSPITSSLDWYQILSIHEYRHVNQFDFFNRSTVKIMDYLFGDTGVVLASALSLQSWYFEGDAVWAETNFTDAGRGRLPNFLARLKAILLSQGEIPTYDQFLNGSYKRPLVNQYIYGFVLISEGYRRFGDKFWPKVIEDVSEFPHPFRLQSSFKRISNMEFKDFYNETFQNLKKEWSKKNPGEWAVKPYSEEVNFKTFGESSYFVSYDLDHARSIVHRANGVDEKIIEIPYSKDLTPIDFSPQYAVYNELRPDWRFGFQSSSDLTLIDLKNGSKTILTTDRRLYNAHFRSDHQAILASEFAKDQKWRIVELDLSGRSLRTLEIPGLDLMEASPLADDKLAVIGNDKNGYKSLVIASFEKGLLLTALPASRNTIFGLKSDGHSKILFEGEIAGAQDILLYDHDKAAFSRCTKSPIAAYTPVFTQTGFSYASETPNGLETKTATFNECENVSTAALIDYNYLAQGSEQAIAIKAPLKLADLSAAELPKSSTEETDYNRFDSRGFIPHSWNFFAGRGIGLNLETDNYLNDFAINLQLGQEAESEDPYSYLQVDFRMFPVVFSLLADARKRSLEIPRTEIEVRWREFAYGGQFSIPYRYKRGLYTLTAELGHKVEKLKTDDYEIDDIETNSPDREFLRNTSFFNYSFLKDHRFRTILPPLGLTLAIEHGETKEDKVTVSETSWRNFADLRFYGPGLFANHGFRLGLSGEQKSTHANRYEFKAPAANPGEYVLARGYDYEVLDEYSKATADYVLPLAYPDYNLGTWLYIKQVYAALYYDYSRIVQGEDDRVLDSTGLELRLETKILRFLPIEYGIRYIRKLEDDSDHFQGFLSSTIARF